MRYTCTINFISDIDLPNVTPPIKKHELDFMWVTVTSDTRPTRETIIERAKQKLKLAYGITNATILNPDIEWSQK